MSDSLTDALRPLFPAAVEVDAGVPAGILGRLFPEEEALIARAVEKRRSEFRAGRILARRALSRLGVAEVPILAKERRPLWPEGIVGSISHADGCCAVAVARRGPILGVGLDVEVEGAVTERIFARIATPEEREWIHGRDEPRRWGTVIFSAKEAFYKSLAAVHETWVGFHDVRVEVQDAGTFRVTPIRESVRAAVAGRGLSGRWCVTGRRVFAALTLSEA
ncbi:MAG: 4'-phosphopantetheinyl transferase family protein [Candidatus Eiseniibacteriota bacterium]